MNGFKQWVRAPEPKRKYLVLFAALVFAILIARNLLFPGAPIAVVVVINLVSVAVAHGLAKAVVERQANS